VILLKTKEERERRDVNMQCKKRKATIILIITVEKNEKRGVERRRRVRKKRLEFFHIIPCVQGK